MLQRAGAGTTSASDTLSIFESRMQDYGSCKEQVDDEEFVAWADIKFFKPVPDPGLASQHGRPVRASYSVGMQLSRGAATEAPEKCW